MTTYIYSYNPHSASAKALAEGLSVKRLKHVGSRYSAKVGDTVINWGSSNLPPSIMSHPAQVINNPGIVKAVTNKLSFFEMTLEMDERVTVPWTTDPEQVRVWLSEGKIAVARTKLTGHSGDGIVILSGDPSQELPDAPLYTLYMPKKEEYRVHVYRRKDGAAEVFDVQRKARKLDVPDEEVDWRVRNLSGGFIYQRQDIDLPDVVTDVALKVFHATDLDFGAVDIIYNNKQNRAYALEINTAPGLTGTTLEKYVDMFKEIV